ncbi:hypothetical protein N9X64_00405 [bacterium]|nr:hypothetical protein [bacterium]
MTKVYSPGARSYLNVTTGAGRLLLVLAGSYLMFKPQKVSAAPSPYNPIMEKTSITFFSPISTEGVITKEIQDEEVVQGARDQIQVSYRLTGVKAGKAVITYGDGEKIIESPEAFPVSFTISKSTVISELDKNGYLQVQISVTPASAQAEAHSMSFRYEGA